MHIYILNLKNLANCTGHCNLNFIISIQDGAKVGTQTISTILCAIYCIPTFGPLCINVLCIFFFVILYCLYYSCCGDRGSTVVKVPCYKSEGGWLIPVGVTGFFIDIKSFRSRYGPGVDSASNGNEY
jgi:hypothetical protein